MRNFGEIGGEIRSCVRPRSLQVSRAEPPAGSQIVKLLRRFVHEHDAVCVRCVLKLRVRNLRVNRLPIEQNDFSRLVAVENVRRYTLCVCWWRDKFFERAPLLILPHLRHLWRQLLCGRPLTVQLSGREPLLTDCEIVGGTTLVQEQRPLCVSDELQIRVRNYRKNWLAIHAQQNRWPVAYKNLWRIIVQLHTGRRRLLWRGRNQMI